MKDQKANFATDTRVSTVDVAFTQEIFLKPNDRFTIPYYTVYRV